MEGGGVGDGVRKKRSINNQRNGGGQVTGGRVQHQIYTKFDQIHPVNKTTSDGGGGAGLEDDVRDV